MYIKRHIEDLITRTEQGFKAILLTGPGQVGKSTVLKHLYHDRRYITFDDPILLEETKREPGLFFRNHKPPVILDEVQYITELFSYIKMECDKTEEKGKFLLTGSQQYHLMQNISESLAGRAAILELSGLSLREMQGTDKGSKNAEGLFQGYRAGMLSDTISDSRDGNAWSDGRCAV